VRPQVPSHSVAELSEILERSQSTIYRWIRRGKLIPVQEGGQYLIPVTDENSILILDEIRNKYRRPRHRFIPKEIKDYADWHHGLDDIGWLFKICYSPIKDIQKRQFRLDRVFANYLTSNKVTLENVRAIFATNKVPNKMLISDDLMRGWYNELAFIIPLKHSTLGLSFADITINQDISNSRFAFPSWRVIVAYYTVYFYLRGVTLQKQDAIRLEEHSATIRAFKNNVLSPLQKVLWKFPLDISYAPGKRVFRRDLLIRKLNHMKYAYTAHPQAPHYTPEGIFENVHERFRKKSRKHRVPVTYTIFDYMHDFRIWANYLDIDNLLSLHGSGYKSFMDQNLSLVLFVIGGIAELSYIAVFGLRDYVALLQRLHDLFVLNNSQLESTFANTPPYQRLTIYNRLGLIDGQISLKERVDINAVLLANK
jgi:excisionase family DNA binding protein